MINVRIYLKSGSTMMIGCSECSFTFNKATGSYEGYDIKNPDRSFGIDPKQIEAWEIFNK